MAFVLILVLFFPNLNFGDLAENCYFVTNSSTRLLNFIQNQVNYMLYAEQKTQVPTNFKAFFVNSLNIHSHKLEMKF